MYKAKYTYAGQIGAVDSEAVDTKLESMVREHGGTVVNYSYKPAEGSGSRVFATFCEFPAEGSRGAFINAAERMLGQKTVGRNFSVVRGAPLLTAQS